MHRYTKALTATATGALLLTACSGEDMPAEELELMFASEEGSHLDDVDCDEGLSYEEGETTSCTVEDAITLTVSYEEEGDHRAIRFVGGWGEIDVDLDEWEEIRDEVEQDYADAE